MRIAPFWFALTSGVSCKIRRFWPAVMRRWSSSSRKMSSTDKTTELPELIRLVRALVSKIQCAISLRSVENVDQSQKSECASSYSRCRWDVLMNLKLNVAVLLIAAVPMYTQAQNPSTAKVNKGDAQKVVTIISGDRVKTKTYCDIQKLSEQIDEASAKKDS